MAGIAFSHVVPPDRQMMFTLEPWPFWHRSISILGCSSSWSGLVHCMVVFVSDLYIFLPGILSTIPRYQDICLSWKSSFIPVIISLQTEDGREFRGSRPSSLFWLERSLWILVGPLGLGCFHISLYLLLGLLLDFLGLLGLGRRIDRHIGVPLGVG